MKPEILKGKTIEDIFYREEEGELIIEFSDDTKISISSGMLNEIIIKREE